MSIWSRMHSLLALLLLGVLAGSAMPAQTIAQEDVPLTVAAASDLTPAFEENGRLFTAQTGVDMGFTFGSTGQLAQQIEAGAPVDVFAAASVDDIDQLEEKRLIVPGTKAPYALGRIVLWTLPESTMLIDTVADLANPEIHHIAIANPDHAPYAVAARDAMQHAGVWEELQPKLVLGETVRDTLRYAETGDVVIAIVALSLAIQGTGRWTLIPGDQHEPINQALAVIGSTPHEAKARAFADFINREAGREVMRRYGFVLPGEAIPEGSPAASPVAGAPGAETPTP